MTQEPETKPRRRWFQFSLASLLVLLTIVCVSLGIYVNRVRRHNRAIEFVQQEWHFVRPGYSCKVDWSTGRPILNAGRPIGNWFERLFGENTAIDITQLSLDENTNVDEKGLKHLSAMPKLHTLSLHCSSITDGDMETICSFTQLANFSIGSPQITDVGLRSIHSLSHLTHFSIRNNEKITDEGLAHLASLHNLRKLYLYDVPGVADDGLVHLASLHSLTELHLLNLPGVTDAGLVHLASLHNLKELRLLFVPGVTDVGHKRLEKALPNCRITRTFLGQTKPAAK